MKKKKSESTVAAPEAYDPMHYQAREMVMRGVEKSPAFKKAMSEAMRQLAKVEKSVSRFGA